MNARQAIPWIAVACLAFAVVHLMSCNDAPQNENRSVDQKIRALEKQVHELRVEVERLTPLVRAVPIELNYVPTESDKAIESKLQGKLPVAFEGNKLVNVIDHLQDALGIDVFVDWTVLEAHGIEHDLPVTLTLAAARGDTALTLLLHQASAGAGEPVIYAVIDGVLVISTKSGLVSIAEKKVKFIGGK